jgi:hypothetical protein
MGNEGEMDLQKLNIKIFCEQPNSVPLTDFIGIFHGWIQATDGKYHDVADYSHMQAGPGIVLVANDANVSIDETENRRGLLFSQKSRLDGSNPEKLRQVFHSALANCRNLEEEPALRGKLRFAMNEVFISVNDRAIAANSEEEFLQLKAEVDPIAREVFGNGEISYERSHDPRQRLNLRLKTTSGVDLRQALASSRAQ